MPIECLIHSCGTLFVNWKIGDRLPLLLLHDFEDNIMKARRKKFLMFTIAKDVITLVAGTVQDNAGPRISSRLCQQV